MNHATHPFRAWRAMLGRDFRIWRRTLPFLLPFSLLFGAFCTIAVGSLSKGSESGYSMAHLAVVQEYDTKKGSMMLDLVAMQDFASPVSIVQTEAEDAWAGLQEGRYDAVIVLPDGYARDISRGNPTTARLVLSRGAALHGRIVEVLADFGETLLTTAQFGIFAGQEAVEAQSPDRVDSYLLIANTLYLEEALNALRSWFCQEQVPYAGLDLPYLQWYALLYAALFFQLLALFFLPLRKDCTTPVLRWLRAAKVSDGAFVFGKLTLLFLLQIVYFALLLLLIPSLTHTAIRFAGLPYALLAMALCTCIGTALTLCLNSGAAAAAITALATVGLFTAGGILERMELPKSVLAIGDKLPPGLCARLCAGLLGQMPRPADLLYAAVWCAAALCAIPICLRRLRSGKGARE